MRFDWDANKALINVVKHKISFREATEVFSDPNALEGYDTLHSTNETRFSIIGFSTRRLLFVVYTERSADTVRLISARKVNNAERKIYERRING
jgi:uncharacterized DUF497 family protein